MRRDLEVPRYTVNDYQKWEGDWELIHGYPYAMGSGKMKHQLIALNIASEFKESIKKSGCDKCRAVNVLD